MLLLVLTRRGHNKNQWYQFKAIFGLAFIFQSGEKTDDDYQVDDMFLSRANKNVSDSKNEEKDRYSAIMGESMLVSLFNERHVIVSLIVPIKLVKLPF